MQWRFRSRGRGQGAKFRSTDLVKGNYCDKLMACVAGANFLCPTPAQTQYKFCDCKHVRQHIDQLAVKVALLTTIANASNATIWLFD